MIKIEKITIPIYNQWVYFILGNPYEVQDYLADAYRDRFDFDPGVTNAVTLHKGLTTWIWFDTETVTVPVIVHELVHAVFDLMIDLGLELTDQEAFCYLDEFLMEKCVNLYAIQMDPINLVEDHLDKEDEQVSS